MQHFQVRRVVSRGSGETTTGSYIHMQKIGVVVEIEGGTEELCTDVAMVSTMFRPCCGSRSTIRIADDHIRNTHSTLLQ